ncbi:MAG: glycosyltransferase family protein, partial [Planctomycetota bacterium]
MKVLFFSPYPPYPPTFGGTVRIFNLMKQVARQHEVYSLCFVSPYDPPVDRSPLHEFVERHEEVSRPHPERKRLNQARSLLSRRSFQNIAHRTETMQRALDQMVAEEGIDVIVVEFSQMACFDFPDGPAIVIDEHNVEWDLLYREYLASPTSLRKLYQLTEYQKFRREEMQVLAKADVVTVTSPRDRELLLRHDPMLDIDVVEN